METYTVRPKLTTLHFLPLDNTITTTTTTIIAHDSHSVTRTFCNNIRNNIYECWKNANSYQRTSFVFNFSAVIILLRFFLYLRIQSEK